MSSAPPISQNARSHGLTMRELHIPDHELTDFGIHRATLFADILPNGALQTELFDQLLTASWKLRRIQCLEDEIFQNEANPLLDEKSAKALDRLNRYQATAERSFQRALKQLRELQTNHALRTLLPIALDETYSVLVHIPALNHRPRLHPRPAPEAMNPPSPLTDPRSA